MSEQDYREKIDKYLVDYFYIDREVWSTDKTSRIDYVLECKESCVLFGLEVKDKTIRRGAQVGEYLKQALRYSDLEFDSKFGVKKIPIFISPAISSIYREVVSGSKRIIDGDEYWQSYHKENSKHSNVNSLIGSFNVGEIRTISEINYYYFAFIFKNKLIWRSEKYYTELPKYKPYIYPRLNEGNYKEMLRILKIQP